MNKRSLTAQLTFGFELIRVKWFISTLLAVGLLHLENLFVHVAAMLRFLIGCLACGTKMFSTGSRQLLVLVMRIMTLYFT